jgi:alcohol dehydrogenase class IV
MKAFQYFQPTEIVFGAGRVKEVGEIVSRYGKRCILVTVDEEKFAALKPAFDKVKASLKAAGVDFAHFQGVVPNPTTDSITEGTKVAAELGADVALGVGGGSSMDTAKAIAVELTHDGTSWDYLWSSKTQPTEKTLPNIAVTTTSGTGSQVTPVSVLTNPAERDKSAIVNPIIYPKVGLVDPELMLTVPQKITASTGFDVFCHAFEAILNPNSSPYIELIGFEAIRIVIKHLSTVVKDGSNLDARSAMAWADTLGGLSIANAGVTLPHGMGMAIGGMYPHVSHGLALALVYPAFMRYTYQAAIKPFATLGRIFDPGLESASDEEAAEKSCDAMDALLKEVGLWTSLEEQGMPEEEVEALAKQCMALPDYEGNPRVATLDEMKDLVVKSYRR